MFGGLELVAIVVLFVLVTRQRNRLAALENQVRALSRNGLRASSPDAVATASEATAAAGATASVAATSAEAAVETSARAAAAETTAAAQAPMEQAAPAPADAPAASADAAASGPWSFPRYDAPPAPPMSQDIETALGTRWAVWVGGMALALGGLFLVRYTIEAGYFGPGARLTMATLFGLALLGGGEFVRRTGYRVPLQGIANAYIPAILTAAGAFTLFGVVYAAHGIYGFIGPTPAFVLLGLVGMATIAAALVHGQALAGLGLLGALATPLLVSSQSPNAWTLFGYLAIVLAATAAIARLRLWTFLMAAALAGTGIWTLLYIADVANPNPNVVFFISAVTLAVLAFIWLWRRAEHHMPAVDVPTAVTGLFLGLTTVQLLTSRLLWSFDGSWHGAVLILGMLALAAYRLRALVMLFAAGGASVLAYAGLAAAAGPLSPGFFAADQIFDAASSGFLWPGVVLGLAFLGVGAWMAERHARVGWRRAAAWAGWSAAVPLAIVASLWLAFGNLDRDLGYAAVALVLAIVLAAVSEWIARAESPALAGGHAVSAALAGAGSAVVLALHAGFGPGMTTVLLGAAAVLPALATRWRSYPVLGSLCVGAAMITLGRVFYDPTIVGSMFLQTTPVFNWLLFGYGVPALAFGFAAWQLPRATEPRLAMEAAAALFALLTVAMLVRHAMHGGVIDAGAVTLAEQAIYTLIAIGAGAILVALDQRSPSSVLRVGSMAAGVVSVAFIAAQHFVLLNPLLTDESTGRIPLFNLLFLAYLLPAVAVGALALYARDKRPQWYAQMLALTGALLAFAYATFSVRRPFKGEYIAAWRGFDQVETYSYSALWLVLGVALLTAGVKLQSQVLRLASAALIVISVLKVFLLDMSELEGVLRALSFIGLGAVLIGIGLFYQRLLTRAQAA